MNQLNGKWNNVRHRRFILTAILLFVSICFIQRVSAIHVPPGGSDPKIIIREGKINIYGSDLDSSWSVSSFTAGLGPAENVFVGKNFSYDSRGIYYLTPLLDTSDHTHVYYFGIKFQLFPWSNAADFPNQKYYEGDMIIEEYPINKNTPYENVKNWLPQYQFTLDHTDGYLTVYGGSFRGIEISLCYNFSGTLLLEMIVAKTD